MSFTDTAWRLGLTAKIGVAEFRVASPFWIILVALMPRAVLQTLFFTMLGGVIGGPELKAYAFVGSLGLVLTLAGAVAVVEVPLTDVWSGTFYRLRSGRLRPFTVFALRALPYPLLGMFFAVASLVVVGPLTGQTRLTLDLLPWLPVYLLMSVTTIAAGMACAALAVGKRANVLVGNLLAFFVMLAGGVFLPAGELTWVDHVGSALPVTHGLAAVRAGLAGQPWLPELLTEAAIGVGWLVLAWAVLAVQVRRAYRHGFDHFS